MYSRSREKRSSSSSSCDVSLSILKRKNEKYAVSFQQQQSIDRLIDDVLIINNLNFLFLSSSSVRTEREEFVTNTHQLRALSSFKWLKRPWKPLSNNGSRNNVALAPLSVTMAPKVFRHHRKASMKISQLLNDSCGGSMMASSRQSKLPPLKWTGQIFLINLI